MTDLKIIKTILTDTLTNNLSYEVLSETTATKVQVIANSIHPGITTEVDTVVRNTDGKVDCLDMKVWVQKDGQIRHEFFRKPMAYKGVINSGSGIPSSAKRQILFSEGMRRLTCCHPANSW